MKLKNDLDIQMNIRQDKILKESIYDLRGLYKKLKAFKLQLSLSETKNDDNVKYHDNNQDQLNNSGINNVSSQNNDKD